MVRTKEPELVDLGLPSGNLWMKYNLGATREIDYGNYYQFGSLVKIKTSTWVTCPFNNGKNEFDEEYFKTNRHKWFYKNGLLRPEYDIVTQIYGKGFKIPEPKDFQELIDNITQKYIEDYEGTGINGRLFTGLNSSSLFIPFPADIWDISFIDVGSDCSLWSSMLNSRYPTNAYYFGCNSKRIGLYNYGVRCCGGALRGIKVRDE